jgi:hypothetical protein
VDWLAPCFFDQSLRQRGEEETWLGFTNFEKVSVYSWLFTDSEGHTRFAPAACVLHDFGLEDDQVDVLLSAFPCLDPANCGRVLPPEMRERLGNGGYRTGHQQCKHCIMLCSSFGQAWQLGALLEFDLQVTRHWYEATADGMLSTQIWGHIWPVHKCGQSCPAVRVYRRYQAPDED